MTTESPYTDAAGRRIRENDSIEAKYAIVHGLSRRRERPLTRRSTGYHRVALERLCLKRDVARRDPRNGSLMRGPCVCPVRTPCAAHMAAVRPRRPCTSMLIQGELYSDLFCTKARPFDASGGAAYFDEVSRKITRLSQQCYILPSAILTRHRCRTRQHVAEGKPPHRLPAQNTHDTYGSYDFRQPFRITPITR